MNPEQRELLHPSSIRTVVFDIGGVLWESNDPALFKAMALDLGLNPQDIERAIEGIRDLSTNASITEEETLERIMKQLQIPKERKESFERSFDQPEIYKPVVGVQDLVQRLSQNQNIEIYLLSDIVNIGSLHRSVLEALRKYYPWVRDERILISSLIGASKREQGSKAFGVLLERLRRPDPTSVVFIDDIEKYVVNARELYAIQSIHFIQDPFLGILSADRLHSVFAKTGLFA